LEVIVSIVLLHEDIILNVLAIVLTINLIHIIIIFLLMLRLVWDCPQLFLDLLICFFDVLLFKVLLACFIVQISTNQDNTNNQQECSCNDHD